MHLYGKVIKQKQIEECIDGIIGGQAGFTTAGRPCLNQI